MPPETRMGIRLTTLKARIFDVIHRAGVDGISRADINAIVFDGQASPNTIKAHIWQVNDRLAETDAEIRSVGGRGPVHGYYQLQKGGSTWASQNKCCSRKWSVRSVGAREKNVS
jgi:hypothetical protein